MYDFSESVCSQENIMRTTINIQDDLMEALLAQTKAKTKTKAIELSIREYIEKKSIENIVALSGKINIDSDWQKMEEDELNEYRDHR
jgi:Arc/MetJ family transcription regulator